MDSDELKSKMGIKGNEKYRIDPESGKVQKQGFLCWIDTDKRIDKESGIIQEEGFTGWTNTNTKIDTESGVVQEYVCFGLFPKNTKTSIDPDTGVIKQDYKDTDERFDPETGKHQKWGTSGWKDVQNREVSKPETAINDQPKPVSEGVDRNHNTNETSRAYSHDSWSIKECIGGFSFLGLVIGVIYNFFSCLNTKHPPPPQSDFIFLSITHLFYGALYGYLIGAAIGLIIGLMKKK